MKKLFLLLLIFISINSFGQFVNNNPKVFNVMNFGAKHDSTTDDTQSIQAAVNACARAGGGTVFFPNGIYIINGAIQTSIGGVDMNCQIYVPIPVNTQNPVTINFVGESSASPGNIMQTPFSTAVFRNMGVTLYSTYTGTRSTINKGTAIIGTGENSPGAFNINSFTLTNINFKVKANPNGAGPEIGGANGRNALGFSFDNCTYLPDVIASSFTLPTRDISGFETPETGGGASYIARNSSVCGLKWGFIFGEHVAGNQLSAAECYYGFGFKPGDHSSTFERLNSYWNTYGINWYQFGANARSIQVFNIYEYDVEFGVGNTGKYYNTVYTVVDSTNKFFANINYAVVTQSIGLNNANWAMNGGAGVTAVPVGSKFGANVGLTSGSVLFAGVNGNVSQANTKFSYDSANVRLGIGLAVPLTDIQIQKSVAGSVTMNITNTLANAAAQAIFQTQNDAGHVFQTGIRSTTTTVYGNLAADGGEAYTAAPGGYNIMVDANAPFTVATGTGSPAPTRFTVSGAGDFTFGIGKFGITEGSNGRTGQTTLVSGTKAISITGLTTSSRAIVTLVSQGGTVTTTVAYAGVCTSNTLTITALTNAGSTDATDTSVLNYFVINSMNDWIALAIVLGLIRPFFGRKRMVLKQVA